MAHGQNSTRGPMRALAIALLFAVTALSVAGTATPAHADVRITRDLGGLVDAYKAKYARIRSKGERVVIDGACNSACTLLLGIVPLNRVCVTPRASLGFHQAYFDKRWTAGVRVTSISGTAELMSVYPASVKSWIARHGGLTPQMKHLKNGAELWAIVDPCADEF
jgi:hypothetical protein